MSITEEQQRHRQMIEQACKRHGLQHDGWRHDEDDRRDVALLGRWVVAEEDENRSLWPGDEGELYATVVGAPQYGNEHAAFYFKPDEYDVGEQVTPFEDVEPV